MHFLRSLNLEMIAILLCDTCSSQQNENYSSSVNKDNLKFKQEWNV